MITIELRVRGHGRQREHLLAGHRAGREGETVLLRAAPVMVKLRRASVQLRRHRHAAMRRLFGDATSEDNCGSFEQNCLRAGPGMRLRHDHPPLPRHGREPQRSVNTCAGGDDKEAQLRDQVPGGRRSRMRRGGPGQRYYEENRLRPAGKEPYRRVLLASGRRVLQDFPQVEGDQLVPVRRAIRYQW